MAYSFMLSPNDAALILFCLNFHWMPIIMLSFHASGAFFSTLGPECTFLFIKKYISVSILYSSTDLQLEHFSSNLIINLYKTRPWFHFEIVISYFYDILVQEIFTNTLSEFSAISDVMLVSYLCTAYWGN